MKQRNLLKNFEYKSYDSLRIMNNQSFKSRSKNQSPLMEMKIDFGEGKLVLHAARKFVVENNQYPEQGCLLANKNRVQVQMDISPRGVIDLNDISNNGLLLPLEGNILDEFNSNAYTGMLVLENKSHNMQDNNLWRLTFYIYDSTDHGEIKFDLPLFVGREFKMN